MVRFTACILALTLSSGAFAWIIEPQAPVEAPQTTLYQAQSAVSLAQATQLAQNRFPGTVVRAETVSRGGRSIHNIRILGADGRVRTVRIDAQTGAFL